MRIIPAIDIRGGKVVRLTQGLADKEKVYSESPIDVAKKWDSFGVEMIHIVDLDAAFEGSLKNIGIVEKIAKSVKAKIELGGGMRTAENIRAAFNCGVEKVVIGTKALDSDFLKMIVGIYGDRIVVGIDAKNGIVRTKGWLLDTRIKAVDLSRDIEKAGVKTINYTDIARDGTLEGPNLKSMRDMLEATNIKVVVGGGISKIEDIEKLKALEEFGLEGVIVGKALYEGSIELGEAIKICKKTGG